MTTIIEQSGRLTFAQISNSYQQLPKGVYMLKRDAMTREFYLAPKENFVVPQKIYGNHDVVDRWIKSFEQNSEKNMGIILSGIKGSGKTITAQIFCLKSNFPIIIINEPYSGQDFIDFITNPVLGSCIIFIDEFEKIYDERNSDTSSTDLLSIMDGNFPTRLIFLLTVNEFRINEYLVNRLNRIKYRKHYQQLEDEVIEEVISDLLVNKSPTYKQSIYDFFSTVGICTFDLLVNVIKEMNLFGETATECGKHLNLRAETRYFDVMEVYRGREYECDEAEFSGGDEYLVISRYDSQSPQYPKYWGEEEQNYFAINLQEYPLKKVSPNSWVIYAKDEKGNDLHFKLKPRKFSTMVF